MADAIERLRGIRNELVAERDWRNRRADVQALNVAIACLEDDRDRTTGERILVAWWRRLFDRKPRPTRTLGPEGYCIRERKRIRMVNPVTFTMKNGRPGTQGTCPDCGTKMFKIGKLETPDA